MRSTNTMAAKAAAWGAAALLAVAIIGPARAGESHSGRYVMLQVSTTAAKVPVVGTFRAATRSVSLMDLQHEGDRLHGAGTLCDLRIDNDSSLVRTVLPAAFKRSLPKPTLDAKLSWSGAELVLQSPRRTVVVGAELERPSRDRLPRRHDDPRVRDQDRDGHPGVTVRIRGLVSGEVYVAQRSWTSLRGLRVGDGFRGRLRFDNEQVVLGATSSMLEDPPAAKPDLPKSFFRLEKVAASASCADAKRLAEGWK